MSASYIRVSGSEISDVVEDIKDAVDGHSIPIVSLACLVVAILAQKPTVTPAELQEIIKGVTEYLTMQLHNGSTSGAVN